MPKTCIICGKPAGSREHIFPASLGGRRTNKGIYCGPHNGGFSPLASVIKAQLEPINALLAVRSDHKDRAEPMAYTSPEGEELIIFDGAVKRASPDSAATDRSHHVRLNLGGPQGLQAIAYVALTFFAHCFQEHARHPGLKAIKDYVLHGGDNDFAWWEGPNKLAGLPPNPFPFGHAIVVMTSATQEATVFVSLFQSMHVGIRLGALSGLGDKSKIVFINPKAEHAQGDTEEHSVDAVVVSLVMPEPMHAHLERNIRERVNERALQDLLAKIERWTFDRDVAPLLVRLNALRKVSREQLNAEITAIIQEQAHRAYWLMRYLVRDFAAQSDDTAISRRIQTHLASLIASDPADPAKLTPAAEQCLMDSVIALMKELGSRLATRDLTLDDLWSVFRSGHGADIVGGIMFARFR